ELAELAGIWRDRGLAPELAAEVARQLTAADALGAHARDELGLTEATRARPLQAAGASALAFCVGGGVPLLGLLAGPADVRTPLVMVVAVLALGASGALGAWAGGAPVPRAAGRVVAGGLLAMLVTLGIGELTGAALD
ncbi:MAG TPA: VIT1/CCC1 transporter family protein, partial [Acidimicrobiales bacterium]|nr:VIT1/CCC1 transporter family protein [Acidimicrobiales bacterium]